MDFLYRVLRLARLEAIIVKQLTFDSNEAVWFMVGGNFSADPGWKHKVRYHHGDYELIICIHGPINLIIGSQTMVLNANDVLIVPPYTTMKGTVSSSQAVEFYWLHFLLPDKPIPKTKDLPNDGKEKHHGDIISLNMSYHLTDLSDLLILTHQLLTVDRSQPFAQNQQNLFMTLILTQLVNSVSQTANEDKNSALVSQLKEWIRTNIFRSPTLKEIADETELNQQYVSRLFKKYVGMSPKHYMIYLKIQTAQALLIRTNLSVKEISTSAYFSDEKLFMKQFKKMTGVTPSAFRSKYQKVYHNNPVIDPVLPIPEKITQKLDYDRDPGTPLNHQE